MIETGAFGVNICKRASGIMALTVADEPKSGLARCQQ